MEARRTRKGVSVSFSSALLMPGRVRTASFGGARHATRVDSKKSGVFYLKGRGPEVTTPASQAMHPCTRRMTAMPSTLGEPRNPKQLLRLADAMISPDGTSLWVRADTVTGERLDLAIPLAELGDTVQFLVSCADFAISHSDQADEPAPTGMQKNEWAPISIRGIGLGPGRSPDESMLMVRLSCCQLAFPVPGSDLARLADDFARNARTLSAGRGKPN